MSVSSQAAHGGHLPAISANNSNRDPHTHIYSYYYTLHAGCAGCTQLVSFELVSLH